MSGGAKEDVGVDEMKFLLSGREIRDGELRYCRCCKCKGEFLFTADEVEAVERKKADARVVVEVKRSGVFWVTRKYEREIPVDEEWIVCPFCEVKQIISSEERDGDAVLELIREEYTNEKPKEAGRMLERVRGLDGFYYSNAGTDGELVSKAVVRKSKPKARRKVTRGFRVIS